MTQPRQRDQFASDNTAGICPEAWAQLQKANTGAAPAYGDDEFTGQLCDRVREIFETDCDVYIVFNGTAANALALAQLCQPFHSIVCHKLAHIQTDECGAPEFFSSGSKLLLVESNDGKISVEQVRPILAEQHGVHSHKVRVVSVTEATELGTVYTCDELGALCDFARVQNLLVHMDGARFANAVAFLDCAPKDLTWKAGVDVLCFGGTKNGIGAGELVVYFRRDLAKEFEYRVKQAGHLGSKMRFLAAQWLGLLTNDVWLRNAVQANAAAGDLADRLRRDVKVEPLLPVQSNAVFLRLTDGAAERLSNFGWNFYKMIEPDVYRLMCSWATTRADIEHLVTDLKKILSAA